MNPEKFNALAHTAFVASEDREFFLLVLESWYAMDSTKDEAIRQIELCERAIINAAKTLEILLTNQAFMKGE